ncbi:MAG: SMC-Scp complex subunit ScpB [Deltaproteobacteria bacterium]|nr:SMC-Scp complex subunit ScpB [Deltaproteobacteria bacterium]
MNALIAAVEGVLFVASKPLSVLELLEVLGGEVSEERLTVALEQLADRHSAGPDRGFCLARTGAGWQFRTTDDAGPHVTRFVGGRPARLSKAALETLAIVAYRQPCTRSDVERIRGVDSGGVLRALLDRKLLAIAGRRAEAGRPMVYKTSPTFLELFGLASLGDLPSLMEFTELGPEDMASLPGEPDAEGQITLQEYAARRAIEHLDQEVDRRLRAAEGQEPRNGESS